MTETDLDATSALVFEPGEHHFVVAEKAEGWLKAAVKGNGMEPAQVRLSRHDTAVHAFPALMKIKLVPRYAKTQKKGRVAAGKEFGSQEAVLQHLEGAGATLLANAVIQKELLKLLDDDPGKGWDMPPLKHPLESTREDCCNVEQCLKCGGQAAYNCVPCHATGKTPCMHCSGHGEQQCKFCFGSGQYARKDGTTVPCAQCGADGRILCNFCQGRKIVICKSCNGKMRLPCTECAGSGWWTNCYSTVWVAESVFLLDRENCDPGALELGDTFGQRVLATEEHVEIIREIPTFPNGEMHISLTALFPIAEAEYATAGTPRPALVAGLHGTVVRMESFLDAVVKPGLTALQKVAQGPGAAAGALLATAFKTRLTHDALHDVPRVGRKRAYTNIVKAYAPVLSDKYARATVKYASEALLRLGRMPRRIGLGGGTLLAGALAAGWFCTPGRALVQGFLEQYKLAKHILAGDILVWVLGWGASVLIIRVLATMSVTKLFPGGEKHDLQPSGDEGLYALGTTFLAWLGCAFLAATRPEWLSAILKAAGL